MAATLGTLNPLTYRGYVYDHETGLYYLQSRYYNPTIRQFISPDAYISTGQGFMGYNMFAYCGNNPVNYSDPAGTMMVMDKKGYIGLYLEYISLKDVAKSVIKTTETVLSNVDGTCSVGISISFTPSGFTLYGQGCLSVDTKGNVALQASWGGGLTTGSPSVSLLGSIGATTAPNVNELGGAGYQIGGTATALAGAVPVTLGGDFSFMPNEEKNTAYCGLTFVGGVSAGIPSGEFHVEWGKTYPTIGVQFNIFEVVGGI